jgi:ribbon-helix-helix CopG family protein
MSKKIGSRISITIAPEQAAGLKKKAAATGVLQSELIRRAIARSLVEPFDLDHERWLNDAVEFLGAPKELVDLVRSGAVPFEAVEAEYRRRGSPKSEPRMVIKKQDGVIVLVPQKVGE